MSCPSTSFSLCGVVMETFQDSIQSLFSFIINHDGDQYSDQYHQDDDDRYSLKGNPTVSGVHWRRDLTAHNNENKKEWERFMENHHQTLQEITWKMIHELLGNVFKKDEVNISFEKAIPQEFHPEYTLLMNGKLDYLMNVLDKLILMIRGDRIMFRKLEEIVQRKKVVSFWISIANAIVLYLFFVRLIVNFENGGVPQEWVFQFYKKMDNEYLQYVLYQYLKMDFYKSGCISRNLEEISVNFSGIYDTIDSIKLDITKDNQMPETNLEIFQYLLHVFFKYFAFNANKMGEFFLKHCGDGTIYILEIVMNYLISINNTELQSKYAQRISEFFDMKVRITANTHMHYSVLGKKVNLFIVRHCLVSSFISILKIHNSEQIFSLYNDLDSIVNATFQKKSRLIEKSYDELTLEGLDIFQEFISYAFETEIYFRPQRNKLMFFSKTDENILMNHIQNIEKSIVESIIFKTLFIVPYSSLGSKISTKVLPKIHKLEAFIKCCMECYFEEPQIIDSNSSFLSLIYFVLKSQLIAHKGTQHAIKRSFLQCAKMIKEGKECVVRYYPNYHTDSHYQNSKILLEFILNEFTTNISIVYPIEFRIVLNQVVCSLLDNGRKEEKEYISLFNSNCGCSVYSAFDNSRGFLKDPFIYKYLCTFSPISSHYVDIFEKLNIPKKAEEIIEEIYPKLCFRNLIFVDSNQKHRPFLPLTSQLLGGVEELTPFQLAKKFKSFIQFSLYSQLSFLIDTLIICLE